MVSPLLQVARLVFMTAPPKYGGSGKVMWLLISADNHVLEFGFVGTDQ